MEIVIEIPQWEWRALSVIKYNGGVIEGTINHKANIAPQKNTLYGFLNR